MSNVVNIDTLTKLDVPVEAVLGGALDAKLETVLVLGCADDGEIYAASSTGDVGALLLMIEEWKHKLLSGEYRG